MTSIHEVIVRYAETDQMGIAHHSNYAIWFEAARNVLLKQIGHSIGGLEEIGVKMPVSELSCQYHQPINFDQKFSVETVVTKLTCARIFFYYKLIDFEDSSLLASGHTCHAWTNSHLKPINFAKAYTDLYNKLLEISVESK